MDALSIFPRKHLTLESSVTLEADEKCRKIVHGLDKDMFTYIWSGQVCFSPLSIGVSQEQSESEKEATREPARSATSRDVFDVN